MRVTPLSIPDVLLIQPHVYDDHRGFFYESFRQDILQQEMLSGLSFLQDNHLRSSYGVLRGLHYQLPPHAQAKLVRVIQGKVLDVVVDIRKSSNTFGQYISQILSADNKKQLFIPEGFAHGFLTISKTSEFLYKTTNYYSPENERCILWSDPVLDINWGDRISFILSEKDRKGSAFADAEIFD